MARRVFGPTPFARTPAQANPGVINMASKAGIKLYNQACESLFHDSDSCFDCEAGELFDLLKLLEDRARKNNWTGAGGIPMIPEDVDNPLVGTPVNLITSYGVKTYEELLAWERTYINTPTPNSQDTGMLYECLMNSLSDKGRAKINIWKHQFFVHGLPSGVLLLKVIVRESHIDSNATASLIRTQLARLDSYISDVGNDITKFNAHVKLLMQGLRARGETSTDLLVNLFTGYKSASDQEFIKYIKEKESRYEEGRAIDEQGHPFTADALMELAQNKYKILVDKDEWEAPSKEEKNIVALETKFTRLEKQVKQGRKPSPKNDPKKPPKQPLVKPNWLKDNVKPRDPSKPREWNGRMYYWCHEETGGKCDGVWHTHKPKKCWGLA